jgi:hypothetical protein
MSFLPWHSTELGILLSIFVEVMFVGIVFRLDYHRPTSREHIVVQVQLDRLEEVATKDRYHGQALSIGEVHDAGSWSHPSASLIEMRERCC